MYKYYCTSTFILISSSYGYVTILREIVKIVFVTEMKWLILAVGLVVCVVMRQTLLSTIIRVPIGVSILKMPTDLWPNVKANERLLVAMES